MEILHHYDTDHNLKSAEILVPQILEYIQPKSVIDIGCGIGSWLSIFAKTIPNLDFLGIDGSHVPKEMLKIPYQNFFTADLRNLKSIPKNRTYDLLTCLEVAEHLPQEKAKGFVDFLCSFSDTIIFSAAIPNQTGENHINEQFPDYWQELFLKNNFVMQDVFREKNWKNENIAWWYRQNMFLVKKQNSELVCSSAVISTVDNNIFCSKNRQTKLLLKVCKKIAKFPYAIFRKGIEKCKLLNLFLFFNKDLNKIFTHLTTAEKLTLQKITKKIITKNAVVVEIGSFLGASTCFLASGLKSGKIYCIDTWQNDAMTEGNRDTYTEFHQNTKKYFNKIVELRGWSFDTAILKKIKSIGKSIDILFIDGDHSYEGVKKDWGLYEPYTKSGTIVIMHDYGWAEGVKKVVSVDILPLCDTKTVQSLPNMWWGMLR